MPCQMAHPRDLALAWDPVFRHWLLFYADARLGTERLSEDVGRAFKRLTELGFQDSADEVPDYYTPREWRL